MRPGHAERRSHPLPAMTGLAGEIGDLVHGQDGRMESLSPLERVRGAKRDGIGERERE